MISQLVHRTNKDEFYSNWNLILNSVSGEIESYTKNKLEIRLILENEAEQESDTREYWEVIAQQVVEMENIFSSIYLPYIKLSILEDHPLLWRYHDDVLECELSGNLENHNDLTGKLYWLYQDHTGGFIDWRKDFYELSNLVKGKKKIPCSMNVKMYEVLKPFFDDFGLTIEVVKVLNNDAKGYLNRPNAKVLIFGNPDVSPNDYKLGQPFIVADTFTACEIKSENGV